MIASKENLQALPSSLPYPEFLIPPNGNLGSDLTIVFTKQHPACNCVVAMVSALLTSFENMAAPNP